MFNYSASLLCWPSFMFEPVTFRLLSQRLPAFPQQPIFKSHSTGNGNFLFQHYFKEYKLYVLCMEILHMKKYKCINFVDNNSDSFSEGYSCTLYSTNLLLYFFWLRNCVYRRKTLWNLIGGFEDRALLKCYFFSWSLWQSLCSLIQNLHKFYNQLHFHLNRTCIPTWRQFFFQILKWNTEKT
jgi:hypothetical protein